MEGIYDIYCGGTNVGTAKVRKEGLYYCFDCECCLDKKGLFKICLSNADETIMLGTPIPQGQTFRLHTKLPVKRFLTQEPRFFIADKQEGNVGLFIPVHPDAPFLHLKDLKNAVFCIQNGKKGIVIRK